MLITIARLINSAVNSVYSARLLGFKVSVVGFKSEFCMVKMSKIVKIWSFSCFLKAQLVH